MLVGKYKNQSYKPFISNELFIEIADIIILCDKDIIQLNKINFLKKTCVIIFINMIIIYRCINILTKINKNFIIITTSNYDNCFPQLDKYDIIFKLLQSKYLIKLYTKNPSIVHDIIQPIPISLKWQFNSHYFYGENNMNLIKLYNMLCITPTENFNSKELKKNLLYFNFSVNTTDMTFYIEHKNIRIKIKKQLEQNGFKWIENNMIDKYMTNLSTYKFVISPPGKGIDAHRTWESLMVGCIPIVLSSPLNKLYDNLPVLVVSDYTIITEEYLNSIYSDFINKKYDFSSLYSTYWIDMVKHQAS